MAAGISAFGHKSIRSGTGIPVVLTGVEVRALYKTPKNFHSKLPCLHGVLLARMLEQILLRRHKTTQCKDIICMHQFVEGRSMGLVFSSPQTFGHLKYFHFVLMF